MAQRETTMTLKKIIGALIVAVGFCLATRDASAAVFQAASPSDANWIRHDTNNVGGVYNSDTQNAHYVTAPGAITIAPYPQPGDFTVAIHGIGNWGTVSCDITAYSLTTNQSKTHTWTFSGNGFFTINATLSSAELGPNPSGLYVLGVICALPPVNAEVGYAQVLGLTTAFVGDNEIAGPGWTPMMPADAGQIFYTAYGAHNADVNAHFVTAAIPPQQRSAGNHSITFYGYRASNSSTYSCSMYLTNLATGTVYVAGASAGTLTGNFTMDATVNVPTTGLYDVGLVCKLPSQSRLYGARNFR